MLSREDVEAHALRARGWTISAIARHLNRDRKTVRAYLSGERVAGQRRRSAPDGFDRFVDYCRARLAEDPHLWATTLFDELARSATRVVPVVHPGAAGPGAAAAV